MADRSDGPPSGARLGPAAASARITGAMTLVAGGADRPALYIAAGAGADPAADRAGHFGAAVAAAAEIRLPVARIARDALELSAPSAPSAPSAETPRSAVAVVAEVPECPVVVNEGGGCGLSAAHTGVHRAFPAAPADGWSVFAADGRSSGPAALGAYLEDLRVRVVAGIAVAALGAAGRDGYVLTAAAGACRLPAPGVVRGAEPSFGTELAQVASYPSAVCTTGTDHGLTGGVRDFSEPRQNRRTAPTMHELVGAWGVSPRRCCS